MQNRYAKYRLGAQEEEDKPYTIKGPPLDPLIQQDRSLDVARDQVGLGTDRYQQRIAAANAVRAEREAATAGIQENNERARYRSEQVDKYRNEFNSLPQVKEFNSIRAAGMGIERLSERNSPYANMALIFSFMKALDSGSTVREGEYANAQNAAGIPDKVRNAYNQTLDGRMLSADQRQDMARTAGEVYMAKAGIYNEVAKRYQPYFKDLGEDPNKHILLASGALNEDRASGRAGPGDIGFNMPDQPKTAPTLTPDQQNAYDAFMKANPSASAKQLYDFTQSIGMNVGNIDEIIAFRDNPEGRGAWASARGSVYDVPNETKVKMAQRDILEGEAGVGDLAAHGATLGWSDQAAGVGNAVHNAITAPFMSGRAFDPIGAYQVGRDSELMRLDEARDRTGWVGTGAEILGGLASGRPGGMFAAPPPATLGGRVWTGMKAGAAGGAVGGAGYGEGLGGTAVGAAGGAAAGTVLGGVLPLAGRAIEGARNYAARASGRTQADDGMAIIGDAINADGNTLAGSFNQMREANRYGVPAMLADSGDNARGLMAASARHPGPGKTQARNNLTERQEGLADRVTSHVQRDLGPASNPYQVADDLMEQASTAASPLYERTYSRPGADRLNRKVGRLLQRPSMKKAMQRAYRIALEEDRDPTSLGFDLGAGEEVVLTRTPSWQTFDYIKRGMDDVIETYRDKTSGRLNLDEEGRAINNTLRTFLIQADQINPDYAVARAAWAGPVRAKSALERGRKALNMTADDLTHAMRDMSENETEFFRLGLRRAMVEAVEAGGDQADAVRRLIGSGKKRAALSRMFGGRQEFDRFINTMRAEGRGIETNRRAMHGSPTDLNRLESGVIADENMGFFQRIANGDGVMASIAREVMQLSERGAFGSGEAAQRARQEIARILSTTDPREAGRAMAQISKLMVRQRVPRRAANARAGAGGLLSGYAAGDFIGPR